MLGDAFNSAVMELNASNDRGIDVVRNKIKMFAQQKCTLPQGKHKIIILDEADSMTEGAQQVRNFFVGFIGLITCVGFAKNYGDLFENDSICVGMQQF